MAWITVEDVRAALGLDPTDDGDDAYLEGVAAAACSKCFKWRLAWGYVDNPQVCPDDDVKLGTVNYAVRRYHERGTGGSFAGSLSGATLIPIRAIWSDLGGPRPRTDVAPTVPT